MCLKNASVLLRRFNFDVDHLAALSICFMLERFFNKSVFIYIARFIEHRRLYLSSQWYMSIRENRESHDCMYYSF